MYYFLEDLKIVLISSAIAGIFAYFIIKEPFKHLKERFKHE